MEGLIVSFRRGRHTISENQMLANVNGIDSKEKAAKLVGKAAVWKSTAGKEIKGKISSCHGKNGVVRIIFEKGMPGQSIGTKVSIA